MLLQNTLFVKRKFRIDEGEIFEGYTQGVTWNGWECPYFERDTVKAIMNDVLGKLDKYRYDTASNAFIVAFYGHWEEQEEYRSVSVFINGEYKILYPIGAGSWCWDKVSENIFKEEE